MKVLPLAQILAVLTVFGSATSAAAGQTCTFTLQHDTITFGSPLNAGQVGMTNSSGCPMPVGRTATTSQSWLTASVGSNSFSPDTVVGLRAEPNATGAPRTVVYIDGLSRARAVSIGSRCGS